MKKIQEKSKTLSIIRNKWLQVGIAGIPYIGGPIQVYLSNVVNEVDQENWAKYWDAYEKRISELEHEKIDYSYFDTPDFILRLRRIYSQVTSGIDEEKLAYLRDYFISCASKIDLDHSWKDLFLDILNVLTGTHLIILRTFYDHQKGLSYIDRFQLPQRNEQAPLTEETILNIIDSTDNALIELILSDLNSKGLIANWMGEPIEPKGWSITNSGNQFMEFLTNLWN